MSSSSSSHKRWTCSRCTYEHQFPGPRCVMCNELRVSKQEMQDFLAGKTIQQAREHRKQDSVEQIDGDDDDEEDPSDARRNQIGNSRNAVTARSNQKQGERKKTTSAKSRSTKQLPKPSKPLNQQLPKGHRMLSFSPGPIPLDPAAASTWIYPCSPQYPKRQYQYEMCETALSHNTLVSLPTGLGKTFIAATVVYNYYRWFPTGRILFLAPTLPLVQQQVQACYRITGIPVNDTGLLTGKLAPTQRQTVWNKCRVLFGTPQTIQHDLVQGGKALAQQVVCIVLDEAHKAVGEYAYVKVMELLAAASARCRVLGLSATPGTSIQAIQKVVTALQMNRLETRTEQDVSEYTHDRASEVVLVPTATIQRRVQQLLDTTLLDPLIRRLKDNGLLQRGGTTATLTPYCVLQATQAYAKEHTNGPLMGTLIASQKLVQIRCDIHRQGLGVVRNKLQQCLHQPARGVWSSIVKSEAFQELWEIVRDATNTTTEAGGSNESHDRVRNNPKLQKLIEVLLEHFARHNSDTRVIVFSQFRESVGNIQAALEPHRPQIRPRHFVGQSNGTAAAAASSKQADTLLRGMKQAEQQRVITEFRNGLHNVLVCTCIGEEGLDIGQVDLIVNFDCLSSPIRMMQRVGRTGRKRNGRVVTLVSEGAEQATHRTALQKERNLLHALRNPRSFTVAATVPLLPQLPACLEREVTTSVDPVFHFSQMEGVKKVKRAGQSLASKQTAGTKSAIEGATLGWESPRSTSPTTRTLLLQCFIPARTRSKSRLQPSRGGPASRLLRRLEQTYGEPPIVRKRTTITQFPMERQTGDTLQAPRRKRSAPTGRSDPKAQPTAINHQVRLAAPPMTNTIATTAASDRPQPKPPPPMSTIIANPYAAARTNTASSIPSHPHNPYSVGSSRSNAENPLNIISREPIAATLAASTRPSQRSVQPPIATNNPYSRVSSSSRTAGDDPVDSTSSHFAATLSASNKPSQTLGHPVVAANNPYSRVVSRPTAACSSLANAATSSPETKCVASGKCGQQPVQPSATAHNPYSSIAVTDKPIPPHSACTNDGLTTSCIANPYASSGNVSGPQAVVGAPADMTAKDNSTMAAEGESNTAESQVLCEFKLPTQDDDDDSTVDSESSAQPAERNESPLGEDVRDETKNNETEEEAIFCLPSPNSSSSSDDDDEDDDNDVTKSFSATLQNASAPDQARAVGGFVYSLTEHGGSASAELPRQSPPTRVIRNPYLLPSPVAPERTSVLSAKPNASFDGHDKEVTCFSVGATSTPSAGLPSRAAESSEDTSVVKAKRKREFIIEDTPDSSLRRPVRGENELLDTPATADDSCKLKVKRKKALVIADTPDSEPSQLEGSPAVTARVPSSCSLTNTQSPSPPTLDPETVVCALCTSRATTDDDPIILCDGCDMAVHVTCYAADVDWMTDEDDEREWLCDLCHHRNTTSNNNNNNNPAGIVCSKCDGADGILKQAALPGYWLHVRCPIRKLANQKLPRKRTPLIDLSQNDEEEEEPDTWRKKRRQACQQFIETEALAGSDDDDGDEDEDELAAMEEEEANTSFINDSSQVGYSQHTEDELDLADRALSSSIADDAPHRALDAQREKLRQFDTPLFNRRQNRMSASGGSPNSCSGLGNLHFVRSVLEHHKQGGDAADIEKVYRQLEDDTQEEKDD